MSTPFYYFFAPTAVGEAIGTEIHEYRAARAAEDAIEEIGGSVPNDWIENTLDVLEDHGVDTTDLQNANLDAVIDQIDVAVDELFEAGVLSPEELSIINADRRAMVAEVEAKQAAIEALEQNILTAFGEQDPNDIENYRIRLADTLEHAIDPQTGKVLTGDVDVADFIADVVDHVEFEEAEELTIMQCALLAMAKPLHGLYEAHLKAMAADPNSTLSYPSNGKIIRIHTKNPGGIVSKLKGCQYYHYISTLTPKHLSLMIPKLKISKIIQCP